MVACKKCDSMNSVDGAYCKKCGASLPEEELAESRTKLQGLVKEGFQIYSEGRTDEARAVAEAALLTNPAMAEALSLKGVCHERDGEIAEALECFEKVVELNPDSTLDRITINRLRNKLASPAPIDAPKPNRRLAIAGAIATAALVLALGGVFGTIRANAANKVAKIESAKVDQGVGTALTPLQEQSRPQNEVKGAQPTDGTGGEKATTDSANSTSGQGDSKIQIPNVGGTELPKPQDDGNRPFSPNVEIRPTQGGATGPGSTGNSRPTEGLDPNPKFVDPSPPAKQEDPGVIEIKVSPGRTKTPGGTESVGQGQGAKALLEAANAKFTLGRYGEAAQAYQSAIAAGAKPGSANQRLGDCYKHLGQRDAAIAAYSSAAKAYEAGGNARAAEVCRQAVKDLGG